MTDFSEISAARARSEGMRSLKPESPPTRARSLFVLLAALAGIDCSGNKNYEERALIAEAKPEFCVGSCTPDEPPPLVDCAAAEAGLEFLRIWDFETRSTDSQGNPVGEPYAEGLYEYDDESNDFRFPYGYEPPSTPIARCGGGNEHALHVWGGPFWSWGGGIGRRVDGIRNARCTGDPLPDYCPGPNAEFPENTLDLSQWEGISFWARRGPDGQPGLRVAVGDKRTDDDLSYFSYRQDPDAPRYCERVKECGCRSKPCTEYIDPNFPATNLTGYYCYDPAVDPPPAPKVRPCDPNTSCGMSNTVEYLQDETQYETCGPTRCEAAYEAFPQDGPDPQFAGRPCTTFAFRGGIVGDYCYDPVNGPPPAEQNEQCGDHWLAGVTLTNEWQFFKVPFTELLQQGWAKEQPYLDTSAISLVRMTWDKGWADFWIDDVSFYRKARN